MKRSVSPAILLAALLATHGCGLPQDGVETVDDAAVPYHLLDESPAPSLPETSGGSATPSGPVLFWVDEAEELVPRTPGGDCTDDVEDRLGELLDELAAGPADEFRAQGLATAIPPESTVGLVDVDDRVAYVDLELQSQIDAARLPVAVAQVVLTVTSVPGIDRVALASDGEPVQVPIAGGALTTTPVAAADYASLVPARYRRSAPFDETVVEGPLCGP